MKFSIIWNDIKSFWSTLNRFSKVLWIIFSILYLFIPQFLIIPLSLYVFYRVVYHMKKWKHFFIACGSFLLIFALAIALFVTFLFITTDSFEDRVYTYTDIPLTDKEEKWYHAMIEEVDYYVIDPIMMSEDQPFKMIGIMGYNTGYWFNRDPFNWPVIELIFYQFDEDQSDLWIFVNYEDGIDELSFSMKRERTKMITLNPNDEVTSIEIRVENGMNQVIYTFDEIIIYPYEDQPMNMDFGGQYDPTPFKTFLSNLIGAHLATLFILSLSYVYHKKYQLYILKK